MRSPTPEKRGGGEDSWGGFIALGIFICQTLEYSGKKVIKFLYCVYGNPAGPEIRE
jgi:hypothetical protein